MLVFLKVSDGGTVNLLSRSCGVYNINELGLQKRISGFLDETDSSEKTYRCASHEMRIFGAIGCGASSVVQRAIHIPVHRILALKKINIFEKVHILASAASFFFFFLEQKGQGKKKERNSHLKKKSSLSKISCITSFCNLKYFLLTTKEKRQQLLNEIRTLCEAPCYQGLVEFHGAFYTPDSGQISIALEYMDGGSLADILRVRKVIPEPVLSHMVQKLLHVRDPSLQYPSFQF